MQLPTPREFLYVAPTGKTIRLTTKPAPVAAFDLNDARAKLTAILAGEVKDQAIEDFIAQVHTAVIHGSDYSRAPMAGVRIEGGEIDLAYYRQNDPTAVGIIEVKSPGNSRDFHKRLDESVHKVTRAIEVWNRTMPTRVVEAYIIAGRESRQRPPALPQDIHHLSWSDVVDRLTQISGAGNQEYETVYVVHLINSCRKLLQDLAQYPGILKCIYDRQFEELVAALLFDLGFKRVELTPPRKDGGRDIVIEHVSATGKHEIYYLELKHWVAGAKVTFSVAAHLQDVIERDDVAGGILLSSSGFGPKLLEQEVTFRAKGVHLKDEEDLLDWISGWERTYGNPIYSPLTFLGISDTK